MTNWKIAEAKQRFSELVRAAESEPQTILNRDRRVAVVIDAGAFEQFQAWQRARQRRSLSDAFTEFRKLAKKERYQLKVPARRDRANRFIDVVDRTV